MKRMIWTLLAVTAAFAQKPPSVDEIMARVAENQAKSVAARKQFVYKQEQLVSLRQSNGKIACRETRDFIVAPDAKGEKRSLVTSASMGRCDDDAKGVAAQVDGDVAVSLLGNDKDGVPRDLFPLTAKEQRHYVYRLAGTEMWRGRSAYRITFVPKPTAKGDDNAGDWKGEALIDAEEYQPISVVTSLAQKIPMAVRVLLGTNVRGLGFSVSYERVADGVWFPSGFGGEFNINVLFFYRRAITINMKNSDFKRADVDSKIAFDRIQ
ncbi:MAG TPA: hypothetical protein VHW24_01720 [Bryobacteraceae bacterium]|nr:hypothetical protein [Bryobacteraceae bacterium]